MRYFKPLATRRQSFLVSSNIAYRFLSGYSYNAVPLEAWSISHLHPLFMIGWTWLLLLLVSLKGKEEIYTSILYPTPISMECTHKFSMKSRISRRPEANYITMVNGNTENMYPLLITAYFSTFATGACKPHTVHRRLQCVCIVCVR